MASINYRQVNEEIKNKMPDYLEELGIDVTENPRKNFTCLNDGFHNDKTPSMHYYSDNQTIHCFSCGTTWNIFQLYAAKHDYAPVNGTDVNYNFKRVRSELAAKYGIEIPAYKPTEQDVQDEKTRQAIKIQIERAQAHLADTDYLQKRGISPELAKQFHIGYISDWRNPAAITQGINTPPSPRLIIPTSHYSYLARDTRDNLNADAAKYKKIKVGNTQMFNLAALYDDSKPIFIVEGEIDALSIIQASDGKVNAIGLGSTTQAVHLKDKIAAVIKHKQEAKAAEIQRTTGEKVDPDTIRVSYNPVLLLAMDNDDAGEQANHVLDINLRISPYSQYLRHHYIVTSRLVGSYDDANEALVKDKESFQQNISKIIADPEQYLTNLIKRITERSNKPQYIPTGFKNLDQLLDGGLYPQLYVLGAESSTGKTTFALQMANNIAAQHHPVFFFSLETSRDTLTEKIISSMTFIKGNSDPKLPQSVRSIDNGYFAKTDNKGNIQDPRVNKLVTECFGDLGEYYKYLLINNGITNRPTAQQVYDQVEQYCISHPNAHPVVIVDYLQILAPMKDGLTDKEAVTSSIAKLNEMTEQFNAPVILISSLNRAGYGKSVKKQSYKESGEIEYYSDVLLGLQYQDGHEPDDDDPQPEDPRTPRLLRIKFLKNRNGNTYTGCNFAYYSQFNYFEAMHDKKRN